MPAYFGPNKRTDPASQNSLQSFAADYWPAAEIDHRQTGGAFDQSARILANLPNPERCSGRSSFQSMPDVARANLDQC